MKDPAEILRQRIQKNVAELGIHYNKQPSRHACVVIIRHFAEVLGMTYDDLSERLMAYETQNQGSKS